MQLHVPPLTFSPFILTVMPKCLKMQTDIKSLLKHNRLVLLLCEIFKNTDNHYLSYMAMKIVYYFLYFCFWEMEGKDILLHDFLFIIVQNVTWTWSSCQERLYFNNGVKKIILETHFLGLVNWNRRHAH